jgi:hypothetical protein
MRRQLKQPWLETHEVLWMLLPVLNGDSDAVYDESGGTLADDSVQGLNKLVLDIKEGTTASLTRANRILAEYQTATYFMWDEDEQGQVVESYLVESIASRRSHIEEFCIRELLELLSRGGLGRLRQCFCGRWFYARRRNQRTHAPKCRQKQYEQREGEFVAYRMRWPSHKAFRADYMKWHYHHSPHSRCLPGNRTDLLFPEWIKQQRKRGK